MTAQWQGLQKNIGVWSGSFDSFSPTGAPTDSVPSELSLLPDETGTAIQLCLKRFPPDQAVNVIEMQFNPPGPGPLIPFFEQGSFSQGALQYSSFARFGAELAMLWGDRRLRIIQHYPAGSQWTGVTLICETRADQPAEAPLTPDKLVGHWQGQAQTLFSDFREPETVQTTLEVRQIGNQLQQTLTVADQVITSEGEVDGPMVNFSSGPQPMRLLMLPGGGSSLCPTAIAAGEPFFLEAGWLVSPTLRLRLIRRYRANGEWESLSLVEEHKQP